MLAFDVIGPLSSLLFVKTNDFGPPNGHKIDSERHRASSEVCLCRQHDGFTLGSTRLGKIDALSEAEAIVGS